MDIQLSNYRVEPDGGIIADATVDGVNVWRQFIVGPGSDPSDLGIPEDVIAAAWELWTPEVQARWPATHPQPAQAVPMPPSPEDRLAVLESALGELATTGTLSQASKDALAQAKDRLPKNGDRPE
jgi:hypothetical protein